MATKDPHIAMIDAHEKIELIKKHIAAKIEQVKARVQAGERLSEEEQAEVARFRRRMVDATRRVQEELAEELHSHGFLGVDNDNQDQAGK